MLHVTWMGGPEGSSAELQPGISSAGCQGQASRAPPPAWPELPSLGENCHCRRSPGGWGRGSQGILLLWEQRGNFLGVGVFCSASVFPRPPLMEKREVLGSQVALPHPGKSRPLQALAHPLPINSPLLVLGPPWGSASRRVRGARVPLSRGEGSHHGL